MTSSPEQGCVFCKIIAGELPARIVCENEHTIGILDIMPRFGKGQCVVFPKKHVDQFYDLDNEDIARLSRGVREVARKINKAFRADMVSTFLSAGGWGSRMPILSFSLFQPRRNLGTQLKY